MKLPAFTRDGRTCNHCGGPVEYNAARAIHEHTEAEPDCHEGDHLAAQGFGNHQEEEPIT